MWQGQREPKNGWGQRLVLDARERYRETRLPDIARNAQSTGPG